MPHNKNVRDLPSPSARGCAGRSLPQLAELILGAGAISVGLGVQSLLGFVETVAVLPLWIAMNFAFCMGHLRGATWRSERNGSNASVRNEAPDRDGSAGSEGPGSVPVRTPASDAF